MKNNQKYIKTFVTFLVGLNLLIVQNASAHGVTRGKAIELALHRLEKLVFLKKIDQSFETNLESASVEEMAHSADTSFRIVLNQVVDPHTDLFQLELNLDDEGFPLNFKETKGVVAQSAPKWPVKKAVELSESAFHYLFDYKFQFPELNNYVNKMAGYELKPGMNSKGEAVAFVSIRLSETGEEKKFILRIRMKLNGDPDFINGVAHEILN